MKKIFIFICILGFCTLAFAQEKYAKINVTSKPGVIKKDSAVSASGNTSIESFKTNVSRRIATAESEIQKIKASESITASTLKQLKDNLYFEQDKRKKLEDKVEKLEKKINDLKGSDSGKTSNEN